ncbi:hypothetical protein Peur_003612 [Populus x canadensis]
MGRLKFPTQVTLGESGKSSYSSSCEKLLQLLLPQVGGYYSVHPELAWIHKLMACSFCMQAHVSTLYDAIEVHKHAFGLMTVFKF